MFIKSEEYSKNPQRVMSRVLSFAGLQYSGSPPNYTAPIQKPILPETIALLDKFYAPFNLDLSNLLGDNKWLYTRS